MAPLAANASLFSFNPNGGGAGTINNVALIDQAPGSALAVGGVSAINNFISGGSAAGNNFTLLYQANLSSFQFADTTIAFGNGQGGRFFTFVAGFGETVVGASPFPGTASFALNTAVPSFFNIYASSSIANNSTGTGFANGAPIFSAHAISEPVSNFQVTSTTPVLLDQSPDNVDSFGGQRTVTGGGATSITLVIDSASAGYFPGLPTGSLVDISFINTSLVDPFNQVDPSRCFNTASSFCGGIGGGVNSFGTLGATNGISGPNFEFQADLNQSISAVPEPEVLSLFGLGVLAMGLIFRSKQKAA